MQIVSDPFHPRGAMRAYAMRIVGGETFSSALIPLLFVRMSSLSVLIRPSSHHHPKCILLQVMQIVSDPFNPRGAMRMYAMLIAG